MDSYKSLNEHEYYPMPMLDRIDNLHMWGFPTGIPYRHAIDSICDFGCGTGRLPMWLTVRKGVTFKKLYCIDSNQEALNIFDRNRHLFEGSEFNLIHGDFTKPLLPDKSIELVTSFAGTTVCNEESLLALLIETKRIMKSDGYLCMWQAFPSHKWTVEQLKGLFIEAGFNVDNDIEIKNFDPPYYTATNLMFRKLMYRAYDERRLKRICKVFFEEDVDFLVHGGTAGKLLGSPYIPNDLDILYSSEPDNVQKTVQALNKLKACERYEKYPKPITAQDLFACPRRQYDTAVCHLDINTTLFDAVPYSKIKSKSVIINYDGVDYRTLSLKQLIWVKNRMYRPKDFVALEHLKQLQLSSNT
jgi:SAM-dependent methyltransferase